MKPLAKAWEEYKEAEREAKVAKRRLLEEAQKNVESAEEVHRRQQGDLVREMRARHAEKQAKAAVQAPQPVPEEEDDDMYEDEEEPETGEKVAGTRYTPIELVVEVVAPREVPKPVEVKQKPRVEEATIVALPKRGAEAAAAMWSGPVVLRMTREWWWWMRARLGFVSGRGVKLWRLHQWLGVPRQ